MPLTTERDQESPEPPDDGVRIGEWTGKGTQLRPAEGEIHVAAVGSERAILLDSVTESAQMDIL